MIMIKAAAELSILDVLLLHTYNWLMRLGHRKYYYIVIDLTTYAATTTMEA
jgi:hypothetical protein